MAMDAPQSRLALEMTVGLDAPRERVYRTLVELTALAQCRGPNGFCTPWIEPDLRVGGGYHFAMQPPDGELFHLAGEFLEVTRRVASFTASAGTNPDPDDQEMVVKLSVDSVGDWLVAASQRRSATKKQPLTDRRNLGSPMASCAYPQPPRPGGRGRPDP